MEKKYEMQGWRRSGGRKGKSLRRCLMGYGYFCHRGVVVVVVVVDLSASSPLFLLLI